MGNQIKLKSLRVKKLMMQLNNKKKVNLKKNMILGNMILQKLKEDVTKRKNHQILKLIFKLIIVEKERRNLKIKGT